MKHAKKGSMAKNTAIIIIAAAVCVVLAVLAVMLFGRDGPDSGAVPGTSSGMISTEESASVTEEAVTSAVTSLTETAEPGTTAESPVITSENPSTEYIPPENRDTDFSGCLFIGDSRTEGLMLYSGISGATAYTARGLMVDTYFTSPVVNMNGEKVTVSQAIESAPDFDRVYIMLGVNELGWPYESVFGDCYGKLIDHVKEHMPQAEINVQSIIPVTAAKSDSDKIYNNPKIELFNSVIRDMCADKGVNYVDLIPGICGEAGVLPEDAAFDGIHLQMPYCKKWLDCLKEKMV